MKFSIIVAMCSDTRGIGSDGKLPWKSLKGDMDFFVKKTKGSGKNAVIMGRKTWESLRTKPLVDRLNIVISSQNLDGGVLIYPNLYDAMEYLKNKPLDEVYVIGGGQLYESAIYHPECDKVYITSVHGVLTNCDTFFPELDQQFQLIDKSELYTDKSGLRYHFDTYEKVRKCVKCTTNRLYTTTSSILFCETCIKDVNLCQICNDEIEMSSQICSRCMRK